MPVPDHFEVCGLTVAEYDVGSALTIGDAELTFRELVHPGTSRAIRVEAGGGGARVSPAIRRRRRRSASTPPAPICC